MQHLRTHLAADLEQVETNLPPSHIQRELEFDDRERLQESQVSGSMCGEDLESISFEGWIANHRPYLVLVVLSTLEFD